MLDELRALEDKLLRPEVRSNRDAASSLIADDFREFGSSGRVFTKAEIFDLMADESASDTTIKEFSAVLLAADAALVTYRAISQTTFSSTLRSSLGVRCGGRWQMLFHQGTISFDSPL